MSPGQGHAAVLVYLHGFKDTLRDFEQNIGTEMVKQTSETRLLTIWVGRISRDHSNISSSVKGQFHSPVFIAD